MGFGTHSQTSIPIQLRQSLDKTLELKLLYSFRTEEWLAILMMTLMMSMMTHSLALPMKLGIILMRITLALKNTLNM
jgi:hypothetical protein